MRSVKQVLVYGFKKCRLAELIGTRTEGGGPGRPGLFGWPEEVVAKGDFNPKMYNSFTDGTKAAIEMAAVANATGIDCPDDGLALPPVGLHDLARVFRPVSDGRRLPKSGLVDIAASQEPNGREVLNDIDTAYSSPSRPPATIPRPASSSTDCSPIPPANTRRCGGPSI
jgi:hypothetical protein